MTRVKLQVEKKEESDEKRMRRMDNRMNKIETAMKYNIERNKDQTEYRRKLEKEQEERVKTWKVSVGLLEKERRSWKRMTRLKLKVKENRERKLEKRLLEEKNTSWERSGEEYRRRFTGFTREARTPPTGPGLYLDS